MTEDGHLPFNVVLRRAMKARGLSLDRIVRQLATAGTPVSLSTLSNWQRGTTTPRSAASRRAIAQLEAILELPGGELVSALTPYAGVARRVPTRRGAPALDVRQLQASFGIASDDLAIVRLDEYAVVRPNELMREMRMTVRAERTGVDRTVVMAHPDVTTHLDIKPGRTCRLGAIQRHDPTGLFAAELLFDTPLTRGELYPVTYETTSPRTDLAGYVVTGARPGLMSYSLTVEFDPAIDPPRVYQVWRQTADSPHKWIGDLRLIDRRCAHLWLHEPPPGTHGIRWEPESVPPE